MKKKLCKTYLLPLFVFFCLLFSQAVMVQGAQLVKPSQAAVSVTSSKIGWVKINGNYYCYNPNGRLVCGLIKYKGNYYYSLPNGRRYTGWLSRSGKKYYFDRSTGIMYRSRWATGTKYKYYFNSSGVAIASQWLTYGGNRYYFLSNSTMATGWTKIGNYYYYFNTSTGVMAKNTWIGNYYVDSNGRRTNKKPPDKPVITESTNYYTYNSSTLSIELRRKSVHGVSYWVAHVRTKNSTQLKSALSYGTYGGTRQTTQSAVTSNGGIIGVNGSAFDYDTGKPSPLGMCIKNGKLYGDYMTSYSVMAVKNDGTIYTPPQGLMGADLLKAGVKDTYNFGPIIINNGKIQPPWAETNKYYPRTAVGMVKKNDYVLLVTDTGTYTGLNHWDMANIFLSYGCQYAYNLDGGGSSTLCFNGKVMNKLIGNYQRPCADFLYFTR